MEHPRSLPRPPYDTELEALLSHLAQSTDQSSEAPPNRLTASRQYVATLDAQAFQKISSDPSTTYTERTILILILRSTTGTHWGNGVPMVLPWLKRLPAIAISPSYRHAPEHPDPAPVSDCYATLAWAAAKAALLNIDPTRILVALMARDRRGPELRGQARAPCWTTGASATAVAVALSNAQFANEAWTFDGAGNAFAWCCLLGAEPFRDEVVMFAEGVWKAGGRAELHVWPGAPHGFDSLAPGARLSREAVGVRGEWGERVLG